MPDGTSVDSKLDRRPTLDPASAKLLPDTPALLSLGLTLGLFGLAAEAVIHSHFSLFSTFNLDRGTSWAPPFLFGIVGLLAFLLLRLTIRIIDLAIYSASSQTRPTQLPPATLEAFIEKASLLNIDPRIAREAFQHLAMLLPDGTSLDIHDNLSSNLNLSETEIATLFDALPGLCDRCWLPVGSTHILTVYDLLAHIGAAPASKSVSLPPQASHHKTLLPLQPASPHADLKNASPRDSRFRTRAHFSGVKRRASDYSGPFRRATDRPPDADYKGPRRRASDLQQDLNPSSPVSRPPDRRLADRRSAAHQIPAQQMPDPRPAALPILQEVAQKAPQHEAASTDSRLLRVRLDVACAQKAPSPASAILPAAIPRETAGLPASFTQQG